MDCAAELLAISREVRALEDRFERIARKNPLAGKMLDEAEHLPFLNTSGCAGDLVKIAAAVSVQQELEPCEEDIDFADRSTAKSPVAAICPPDVATGRPLIAGGAK